jgi:hypothetical protein
MTTPEESIRSPGPACVDEASEAADRLENLDGDESD